MKVLIDTSVWSAALRKKSVVKQDKTDILSKVINDGNAVLIGPVRQEILSGIRDSDQFSKLKKLLHAFPDHPITPEDYETAAEFFNTCRSKGIQGSNTDFLICAVAYNNNFTILTSDKDFNHYKKYLKLKLL